jgi:hypothetical protein
MLWQPTSAAGRGTHRRGWCVASPLRTVDTRSGIGGPAGALPGRSTTEYLVGRDAPSLNFSSVHPVDGGVDAA